MECKKMNSSTIALAVVMNQSVWEELNMMRKVNKILNQFINHRNLFFGKNLELIYSWIDILKMDSSNTALSVVLNHSVCEELMQLREENTRIANYIKYIKSKPRNPYFYDIKLPLFNNEL